ncbi:MAG: hypothetical protein ACRDVM_06935 [Acidimicrobiia bacterium]
MEERQTLEFIDEWLSARSLFLATDVIDFVLDLRLQVADLEAEVERLRTETLTGV